MKLEHIKSKDFNTKYPTYFKKPHNKNKFGAKRVIIDNLKFDSKSEGNLYAELMIQEREGLIESVECQSKEALEAYGTTIGNYYVDFKVRHLKANGGAIEFIEHKSVGTVTDLWKWKWKMLLAKYHDEIERGEVICNINWYKGYKIIKR